MIKNYISIAFRGLWRNKLLSFVNIAGLSIGLACVMLIMLFVNDEFSFDKFQTNGPRLFRLVSDNSDSTGKVYHRGFTGLPQGPDFAADLPEIESFCRVDASGRLITRVGNNTLQADVLAADTTFFKLFSFGVVSGNPNHLLDDINGVVLTDVQAEKSFGKQNPVGRLINIQVDDKFEPFKVTGVVKHAPINSSIQFDMVICYGRSMAMVGARMNDWNSTFLNTFFLMHKGADVKKAQGKLAASFLKYNGKAWAEFKKHYGKNITQTYSFQPFMDIHLGGVYNTGNGLGSASDISRSYILTGLGVLILIIACINFINIMLAHSVKRSKEIGVRKVNGGSRMQLVYQFLCESAVITAFAFVPAIIMVELFLPQFSQFADKHFDITFLFRPVIVGLFAGLLMSVAFLAGFYPAFVASGFNPVQTLYGRFKLSGNNTMGKSLVVLQFAIAVTLIISTVVFQRQFAFMTKSDQGYHTENIIRADLPYGKQAEVQLIKNELAKQPSIQMVGAKGGDFNKTVFHIGKKETDWTYYENIDDHYLQLLQVPLAQGRYLSYSNPSDTVSACMVNESFVKAHLDPTRIPIGQYMSRGAFEKKGLVQVVGVVKDYHFNDFKEKIEPVYFSLNRQGQTQNVFVKYLPGKSKQAMDALQKACKTLLPYNQIDYVFLDDWNRQRYSSEEQWKKIVTSAAVIAILISSLGLFALATLATQQRVKEIGIRKVLGASVTNITGLLTTSFLKLVLIAFVIAVPVAWYLMNKWLQSFAYQISLNWWIFVLSAAVTMLMAFLTVSYHTLRAAIANPVDSLRRD